jgi:hypothetical protein
MQAPMSKRNSRNGSGPRTTAGKSIASRNALRHGLAAITHRQAVRSTEIEQFARALCGDDSDAIIFAQAEQVAKNEMEQRAIRAQQVAVIERLREPYLVAFAKKDNTLQLAKGRFMEAWLAEREIAALVPKLLEKYKDQMSPTLKGDENVPEWILNAGGLVPICLKALLQEPDDIDEQTRELARKRIKERDCDEYEALQAAIDDLVRLDRYQRRAWSRQKRAIRQFIALRFDRNNRSSAA